MNNEPYYRKTIDFEKFGIVNFSIISIGTRNGQKVWVTNDFESFDLAKKFAEEHIPHNPCIYARDRRGLDIAMWSGSEWLVFWEK